MCLKLGEPVTVKEATSPSLCYCWMYVSANGVPNYKRPETRVSHGLLATAELPL